jgi:hypothetical protein
MWRFSFLYVKIWQPKNSKHTKISPPKIKSLVLPTPPKDSLQKNKSGGGGEQMDSNKRAKRKKTTNKQKKKKPTNKPRNEIPKNL